MSTFKKYIQSIVSGPCLAITVHNAVLEKSVSIGVGNKRLELWSQLVVELGEEVARAKVEKWIIKPYKMK